MYHDTHYLLINGLTAFGLKFLLAALTTGIDLLFYAEPGLHLLHPSTY